MDKITGIVKWFDRKKGFGFIVPEASGADVFVHASQIQLSGYDFLETGQRVQFSTKEKNSKISATAITLL